MSATIGAVTDAISEAVITGMTMVLVSASSQTAPTSTSTMPTSSQATMPASRSHGGATNSLASSPGSISRTLGSSAGSDGWRRPRVNRARIMDPRGNATGAVGMSCDHDRHRSSCEDGRMTTKADFTDEEWMRLKRAPMVAGMAISLADPGGPIEAVKETSATLKTALHAAETHAKGELVGELSRALGEDARAHHNPLSGFKPHGGTAGVEILDELREVNQIVSEKATPEEAATMREWLLAAAQNAADAAKEGGFMGWHAERVSAGEQRMLDSLAEVLS